ncbi:MAG: hypothetical protein WKG03_12115 [Telluria sp.]
MDQHTIIGLKPGEDSAASLALRKAQLKRQADFYRVGIVHAKAGIRQHARPEALFHNALDRASWALRSRVDSLLRPTGINVASIMPFAVSVVGFIARRRLVKTAIGVLAAAAGLAYYLQHRRHKSLF